MDFHHTGYHDQIQWAADACKIEFGAVPNVSNYAIFSYILSVGSDSPEKNVRRSTIKA